MNEWWIHLFRTKINETHMFFILSHKSIGVVWESEYSIICPYSNTHSSHPFLAIIHPSESMHAGIRIVSQFLAYIIISIPLPPFDRYQIEYAMKLYLGVARVLNFTRSEPNSTAQQSRIESIFIFITRIIIITAPARANKWFRCLSFWINEILICNYDRKS